MATVEWQPGAVWQPAIKNRWKPWKPSGNQ